MAGKGKPIPKSVRMEVFRRDSFRCQYCGRSAPEVILEIDHIKPIAKGGDDSVFNLITSCRDCNQGNGAIELDDETTVRGQKAQLDEMNERREQLEMMLEWKNELSSMMDSQIDAIEQLFLRFYGEEYGFGTQKRRRTTKLIMVFGFEAVYDAAHTACLQYDYPEDAYEKLGGICYNKKLGVNAWERE